MFLLENQIAKKVRDFLDSFSLNKYPALVGEFVLQDYSGCNGSCFGCTGGCVASCSGDCSGGCSGCIGSCQGSCR